MDGVRRRATLISLNINAYDAVKHGALPLLSDARTGLASWSAALDGYRAAMWTRR